VFAPTNSWKFLHLDLRTLIPESLKNIGVEEDIVHIAKINNLNVV